jgi:hypothetical protein
MCLKHPSCRQEETPLPTRVLDVSGSDPVLVSGKGGSDKYFALSHCWGVELTLTTTVATRCQRYKKIPTSTLPATFRDAVVITKYLGVQYLWIDSLCIVQDSIEDWRTESAKMQDYYKNAYLTISALEALSSHHGILHLRNRKFWNGVQLSSEANLYLRPQLGTEDDVFKRAVLNTRAWALQERLLSTRVLHYAKDEIFWECLSCSRRESTTRQQTSKMDPSSIMNSEGGDFKRALTLVKEMSGNPKSNAMTTWYRLVTQYSRRALTNPKDQLPAIAGIAAAIQKLSQYTYLAGLWKEDLRGLLWSREFKKPVRSSPYLAPSWSWAASSSPISMRFGDEEQPIIKIGSRRGELVRNEIKNIGTDCYGQVRDGCITIKAPTLNIEYHQERYQSVNSIYPERPSQLVRRGIVQLSLSKDIGFGEGYLDTLDEDLVVTSENLADRTYWDKIKQWIKDTQRRTNAQRNVSHLAKAKIKKCVAIWIIEGERLELIWPLDGFLNAASKQSPGGPGGTLYCLLVVEDAIQPGKWRRIGIGKSIHHHEKEIKWKERCMCLI